MVSVGIQIGGLTEVKVIGNNIRYTQTGILVDEVAASAFSITDNSIVAVGRHGIHLDGVSDSIISNNQIFKPGVETDNTYDGIFLEGSSDRNFISGNKITPSTAGAADTRYGINISAATCDANHICHNDFGGVGTFQGGDINDAGTGTILCEDGGGGGVDELAELTDVDLTGLSTGDFLQYDGTDWAPVPPPGGSSFSVFSQSGTLSTGSGTFKLPFAINATIIGVQLAVAVSPTGANLIVDVHKNGTTIYTTQANRPIVADGDADGVGAQTTPDVTSITAGEYLTVDIDQIGSTLPGSDLTVVVEWMPA